LQVSHRQKRLAFTAHVLIVSSVQGERDTIPEAQNHSVSDVRTPSGRTLLRTLGRYELKSELGHGGMATVFRAFDPRLGRDVALKVMHRHLRDNVELSERFQGEARAVAKLKHPSIVEIYDIPDEQDGERYLVCELVDGPSLRRFFSDEAQKPQEPIFPPEVGAAMLLEVLEALKVAHAVGIIHRDIKPENILVPVVAPREGSLIKLTDFGIAKILDSHTMTSTGQILGSPSHMSPEQIEGLPPTEKVDVFSAGVLFYELLTGDLPFVGKNPAQILRRVLEGRYVAAERSVREVGEVWSRIVDSMLALDAPKRPTVCELSAKLRAELASLGFSDVHSLLRDHLRNPRVAREAFVSVVVPRLLDRAQKMRKMGDVLGAARDLNRAFEYKPQDDRVRRLSRSLLSSRQRSIALRLGVLCAAIGVAAFFVIHALRASTTEGLFSAVSDNVASENAPFALAASATAASTSASGFVLASAAVATVTRATAQTASSASTMTASSRRKVRVILNPAGRFSVDGGRDQETNSVADLTLGDHTIEATGNRGCCEKSVVRWRIEPGEDEQIVRLTLRLLPAMVYAQGGGDGVRLVAQGADGRILAQGASPLAIAMEDASSRFTSLRVTVTATPMSAPAKQFSLVLSPGDTRYVSLD